ncbi:MAG: sigma 54-interacting transcriptional regulator [Peptococcaceae bacterium]|nr:sigma 54-interacting transcriptional regulator [Peptococcaceae bacterium]
MTQPFAVTSNIVKQWDPQLLFTILDNIQDVVIVVDADTTIIYANPAYATIMGIPVQKVLGKRLDVLEPGSINSDVLRTGKIIINEKRYLSSVGIDMIGCSFPLFDQDKIVGCVSIYNNISKVAELNRELERSRSMADYLQDQLSQLEREQALWPFQDMFAANTEMTETLKIAAKVARTNSTVLLQGESGVGKGMLAKEIHRLSLRRNKPLINVNCAAIPDALMESELFGYEEGAFSGAKKGGKLGKFELAHEGTIFLDEIGDMSLNMQSKLLRVLQEKELERVGGVSSIKLDIRVIAATNRDLEVMVKEGSFRQDLYYRLSIVPLLIAPLRERKKDIPLLAQKFLDQFAEKGGRRAFLTPQVTKVLKKHHWPGNIRELQNVMEYAYILHNGLQIELHHLPPYLRPAESSLEENANLEDLLDMKNAVSKLEQELIAEALKKHKNNKSAAIKELGVSRRTFYEKLQKYNVPTE